MSDKDHVSPKLQARAGTPKVELHVYHLNFNLLSSLRRFRRGSRNIDALTVELLGVGDEISPYQKITVFPEENQTW